jgi:hypothetical protein
MCDTQLFVLGWLGEFCRMCGAYLFVLLNVSQAGLELVVAAMADLPCWLCSRSLICGLVLELFPAPSVMAVIILARGSQLPGCGSNLSGRFWSHRG